MKTELVILREARNLLAQPGWWHRGSLYRLERDGTTVSSSARVLWGPYDQLTGSCAVGALRLCGRNSEASEAAAHHRVNRHVREQWADHCETLPGARINNPIVQLNDDWADSVDDVLAIFDKAILDAEQELT